MSVRYKFKNTLSHDTIPFDGNSISLNDFKKTVVQQKHLSKIDDDLKVVNADTKQEFKDDDPIPKNTSLIVSRVPLTPQSKKLIVDKRTLAAKNNVIAGNKAKNVESHDKGIFDLSKMNISEEKKIEVMMEQSTAAYNSRAYQKIPSNTQTGKVPTNYRCNRCYLTGHWVKDCPVVIMSKMKIAENRRNAGIPRSFLKNESEKENKENTLHKPILFADKSANVPEDLLCPICKDIFVDAVMIACCGNSFCDDCVRTALLESSDNKCPSCKETDTSPDSLIPNRFLRRSVHSFKGKGGLACGTVSDSKDKKESKIEFSAIGALCKK